MLFLLNLTIDQYLILNNINHFRLNSKPRTPMAKFGQKVIIPKIFIPKDHNSEFRNNDRDFRVKNLRNKSPSG